MMLDEVNPDVILLEAVISGGVSLSRLVRDIKDIKPYIKIILCAEMNTDVDIIKEAERWVFDIIRKPYNKPKLLKTIRSYDLL